MTMISDAAERLWAFSAARLHQRFQHAAEGVLGLVRDERADVREVTRRLLWVSQDTHADLFAWLTPEFGFPAMWECSTTVIDRLEFVQDFVRYHLLDDGDPGAMWIRRAFWPDERGDGLWVPCLPNEEGAWQVLTPNREKFCAGYYTEAHVTPERVIQLIRVHEERAAATVAMHRDLGATDQDLSNLIKIDACTSATRAWMESEDILPTERTSP